MKLKALRLLLNNLRRSFALEENVSKAGHVRCTWPVFYAQLAEREIIAAQYRSRAKINFFQILKIFVDWKKVL